MDIQLFKDFQPTLLRLANHPYFRKELWIEPSLKDRKIIGILPNAVAYEKDGKINIDFTSSDIYAKRLNILAPEIVGFDNKLYKPLNFFLQHANFATFNSNAAGDGNVGDAEGAWSTARADTTGNQGADSTSTTERVAAEYNGSNYFIYRAFIPFDTSSLGSGATILSASCAVYNNSINGTGANVYLIPTTQASGSALASTDYGNISFTSLTTTPFDCTSTGSKTQSLNATGVSDISKTAYTKFGLLHNLDYANSAPGVSTSECYITMSDNATNKPTLTVTLPAGTGALFFNQL